jgi:hypothetical protein
MMEQFHRPSPALIVATMALLFAVGGSAVAVYAAGNGDSLIGQRSLSGNRLRSNTVTGAEVANLAWQTLTLRNGWHNAYQGGKRPPAVALDVQGIVHFRGAIAGGYPGSFATLPQPFRPVVLVTVATTIGPSVSGRIEIDTAGTVWADSGSGPFSNAQLFTSLEGVTYTMN